MHRFIILHLLAFQLAWGAPSLPSPPRAANTSADDIPYVPTRQNIVRDMLWLAEVTTNDIVYDLGSGDGRVVISAVRDCSARKAVGVEVKEDLVATSRAQARACGVADRVRFIHGDLFTNDIAEASVVILYLGHRSNLRLRPKLLRELQPGTRIVAQQFGMGEWEPEKILKVRTQHLGMFGRMINHYAGNNRVPDFELNPEYPDKTCVALWIVPEKIAGIWKGDMTGPDKTAGVDLHLHQSLKGVSGILKFPTAETNLQASFCGDLWGNHLRFSASAVGLSFTYFEFDGHVSGDSLAGKFTVSRQGKMQKGKLSARRRPANFTGDWEWKAPDTDRSLRLNIARTDAHVHATFSERGKTWPVDDFYDFGGGFYFTHMMSKLKVGPDSWSVVLDQHAGWFIAEAIAEGQALSGQTWWFPRPDGGLRDPGQSKPNNGEVAGPWSPTRINQ